MTPRGGARAPALLLAVGGLLASVLASCGGSPPLVLFPVRFDSTGTVSGRLVDEATGVALEGVRVTLGGTLAAETVGGVFEFRQVPAGTRRLQATRVGLQFLERELEVAPGAAVHLDLALRLSATPEQRAGGRIVGLVREVGTGAPLADVQVCYRTGGSLRGAITRREGQYVLANVPPGSIELRAGRLALAPGVETVTVEEGQTVRLDIELLRSTGPWVDLEC